MYSLPEGVGPLIAAPSRGSPVPHLCGETPMPLWRFLPHGLTGRGPCLQVADVVPATHARRHWADTCPWAALVAAVDRACTQRFPTPTTRGRPPVSTRVLWALEGWKPEVAGADAQSSSRWRTDLAVRSAGGIGAVQGDGSQAHGVLPEVLAHFRRRLDAPLLAERLAMQAATALEDGLVRPAPLVVDPVPRAHGSQRVHDAATRSKAPQKSSRSARPAPRRAPPGARRCRGEHRTSRTPSSRSSAASVASAGGWGRGVGHRCARPRRHGWRWASRSCRWRGPPRRAYTARRRCRRLRRCGGCVRGGSPGRLIPGPRRPRRRTSPGSCARLACRLSGPRHRGAIIPTGLAVMAHHAATLGRLHASRLSTRARTFRRRLRLSCRPIHHGHASINS